MSSKHLIDNIWAEIITNIKSSFENEQIFNECIASSKVYKFSSNDLVIIVKSLFAKTIFLNDYSDFIHKYLNEKLKANINVTYICEDEISLFNFDQNITNNVILNDFKSNLISEYNFDNFVVGEFNKNAYNAITAIVNKMGKLYNPLFICASTGLGKTHLIMALGNYYTQKFPDKKTMYIETDTFVREVVNAMSKGNNFIEDLKKFYSSIDLLLIDDIQFICGKDKCNEVFFQIFNNLVRANKQIVITSDKPPELLDSLEERMISRFASGLTLKINKPDLDSLKKIVSFKLKEFDNNLLFSDEAINEIIKYYNNDLRKLIGLLNQISFYAIQNLQPNEVISGKLIKQFLNENTYTNIHIEKTKINPEMVISIVCKWYSIKEELVKGKSRLKNLVNIRHICMYIMRYKLNLSYTEIGKFFSNRDHTTVMNGIEKISSKIESDSALKEYINKIFANS